MEIMTIIQKKNLNNNFNKYDTIVNGIEYVGKNPYYPTPEEIHDKLDCEKHYDLYIKKKNLVKNKRR